MLLPLLSPHALIKVGRNHAAREVDNQMREGVIEWIVLKLKQKLLAPSLDQHLWTYQVREQLRTEFLSSVLELNVTSYLERAETVVSKMPILF
ncbi:hypothetical protein PN36_34520 [Candidatus Thiomargarita nelsonii]|uniref:Uncharacterized protein n=1 Tax=Candidatus Thiomargarita nelsonii TaxID=1003181 RepID=A0A4E0RM76_9GAMM|nr:hypothetical protein PN36_34520 [Candidatus Thiomargarita nelsonii]